MTVTLPAVAPLGTGAVTPVALQLVGVPAVPLSLTVFIAEAVAKFLPVILAGFPTGPEVTERLVIFGTGGIGLSLLVTLATKLTSRQSPQRNFNIRGLAHTRPVESINPSHSFLFLPACALLLGGYLKRV